MDKRISIHALRGEGDSKSTQITPRAFAHIEQYCAMFTHFTIEKTAC